MVGLIGRTGFMRDPPRFRDRGAFPVSPDIGDRRQHIMVSVGLGCVMTFIVELMDENRPSKVCDGKGKGTETVVIKRLEGPESIDTLIIVPDDNSSAVFIAGNRSTVDISSLTQIEMLVRMGDRMQLEDAAVKRHIVSDIDFLGMEVHVAFYWSLLS